MLYAALGVTVASGSEAGLGFAVRTMPLLLPVWAGYVFTTWSDRPVAAGSWQWSWRQCVAAGAAMAVLVLFVRAGLPWIMAPFPVAVVDLAAVPATVLASLGLGLLSGQWLCRRFRPDGARLARTGWQLCPECVQPEHVGRPNCGECGAVMAGPLQRPWLPEEDVVDSMDGAVGAGAVGPATGLATESAARRAAAWAASRAAGRAAGTAARHRGDSATGSEQEADGMFADSR